MTNREKYAEQILDIACNGGALAMDKNMKLIDCASISCSDCKFCPKTGIRCENNIKEWCNSEYIEKSKISENDRRYLDYLPECFKWIARDAGGNLYAYENKPYKLIDCWGFLKNTRCSCVNYKISFPMVKWEDPEPWLIEDLKELEVEA